MATAWQRRAITVWGVVQGVGFRPFIHGLATRLRLAGFVRNQAGAVYIEVEGETASIQAFLDELQSNPPVLAHFEDIKSQIIPVEGAVDFRIEKSSADAPEHVFIAPDVATCDECLEELFDSTNRRFGYPFINCTNCGPRLTIIQGIPYDRERTTMAAFGMCPACRAEYVDPNDRRFHAQPIACIECGPQLKLLDARGQRHNCHDPLAAFADAILSGRIGALKGLGGFHLVCDARCETTVAELRRRKHRDEKPFAIMVRDVATAQVLCELGPEELQLLTSSARPIVLLRRRKDCCSIASAVAPENPRLGVMLPYTPIHHLLMRAVGDSPLVMTSGNTAQEPMVYQDDEAIVRLGDIADLLLTHNRPIHVACDDSVLQVVNHEAVPLRRARGFAPAPLPLPIACPRPILALGGQLKSVFALGRDKHAFLSQHLGDLDHLAAVRAFEQNIRLYEELFETKSALLAHDLHPDYASTAYALRRAARESLELIGVQHHHAHVASCLAEHGLNESVIGVVFDGAGYGADGAIWGGEFLLGDYVQICRMSHLRYVRQPGGDAAAREPWRMAIAHLVDAGCDPRVLADVTQQQLQVVEKMIERGFNAPHTSSAGRLFDAVAAILGLSHRTSYEGQAAMQLQWLAETSRDEGAYAFELSDTVDTRPLIRDVCRDRQQGVEAATIARRFHHTLAAMIAAVCQEIRRQTNLSTVMLSGGVFMNALLASQARERLERGGFRVYQHRQVPPNDGGLSLGQLAIAAKQVALRSP